MAAAMGGAGGRLSSIFKRMDDPAKLYHFDLDLSKLDNDQCYMIFPDISWEEQAIAMIVEHSLFRPSDPRLNEKFEFSHTEVGGVGFFKCSFPKSCRARVEFIAKLFFPYLKANSDSRLIRYCKDASTHEMEGIHFPASSKLLMFSGPRKLTRAQFLDFAHEVIEASERIGFSTPPTPTDPTLP